MTTRYIDRDGRPRELVALAGARDSVLVVDRDAGTLCDQRLVAHLAADEPPENVALVCRLYLAEVVTARGPRCRPVVPEDFTAVPPEEHACLVSEDATGPLAHEAPDKPSGETAIRPSSPPSLCCEGRRYRLRAVPRAEPAAQLRWCRASARAGPWTPVSLRSVVGHFESYEPMRSATAAALARHEGRVGIATSALRGELRRLQSSPVVLNRGLREAVVRAVEERGLSMSEIAIRCGKVKRDRRGRLSGETSWLARRVGLLPEAGRRSAVRWVHSDVLALIARRGLGVSPREVELG